MMVEMLADQLCSLFCFSSAQTNSLLAIPLVRSSYLLCQL